MMNVIEHVMPCNRRPEIYINPAHDTVTLNKETAVLDDEGVVKEYRYDSVSFPWKEEYDTPAKYLEDGSLVQEAYLKEHFEDLFEEFK